MEKNSQATLFIIIATFLLLTGGVFIYLAKSTATKTIRQETGKTYSTMNEIKPIVEYMNECLYSTSKDALIYLGKQGGNIYQSQGGTTPDFDESRNTIFFLKFQNNNVGYAITPQRISLPAYPSLITPYGPLNDEDSSTSLSTLGVSTLPLLNGTGSAMQYQLEHYVEQNIDTCFAYSLFEDQGYEFEKGNKSVHFSFGASTITVTLNYPLLITNSLTKEQSTSSSFSAKVNMRMNDIYTALSTLINNDVGDMSFDIAHPTNLPSGMSVRVVRDVKSNGEETKDDIISLIDSKSLLSGKPYEFLFGRHNRNPALHYTKRANSDADLCPLEDSNEGLSLSPSFTTIAIEDVPSLNTRFLETPLSGMVIGSSSFEISSCQTLGTAGATYYLTTDIRKPTLPINDSCIKIIASDITLDCQGHVVDGSNDGYGLYAKNANRLIIKNCIFQNWGDSDSEGGVYVNQSSGVSIAHIESSNNYVGLTFFNSQHGTIEYSTFNSNSMDGINLFWSGYALLRNVTASSNERNGFFANANPEYDSFFNVTTSYNGVNGFYLSQSRYSNIIGLTSTNNRNGFFTYATSYNKVIFSTISDNLYKDIEIFGGLHSCTDSFLNVTGSGNRPIYYINYSIKLQNLVASEIILCNADGSNLTNVTIDGSDTLDNNGLYLYYVENATLRNINSSNNFDGIIFVTSSNNTLDGANIDSVSDFGVRLYFGGTDNTLSNINITNSVEGFGTYNYGGYSTFSNFKIDSVVGSGFLIWGPYNIVNNILISKSTFGFRPYNLYNSTISNLNVTDSSHGVLSIHSESNTYTNFTLSPVGHGVILYGGDKNNNFTNLKVYGGHTGIYMDQPSNNTNFFNTLVSDSITGIYLNGVKNIFNLLTINGTSTSAITSFNSETSATITNALLANCETAYGGVNLTNGGKAFIDPITNSPCSFNIIIDKSYTPPKRKTPFTTFGANLVHNAMTPTNSGQSIFRSSIPSHCNPITETSNLGLKAYSTLIETEINFSNEEEITEEKVLNYIHFPTANDPDEDETFIGFVISSKVGNPELPQILNSDYMTLHVVVSDGELEDYQDITLVRNS